MIWYTICMPTFCVKTLTFFRVWNKVLQAKWPYWPWDHSMVFMKRSLWHGIYQSDQCFSREACFLNSLHNWRISLCATYMYICVLYIYIYIYVWISICVSLMKSSWRPQAVFCGQNDAPGILWHVIYISLLYLHVFHWFL